MQFTKRQKLMTLSFDLISDLHIETWNQRFSWQGLPTSPVCVVAGDISNDRALVVDALEQLGEVYNAVLYIDGNHEHKNYYGNISQSYRELKSLISAIPNVVYMQDNVVITNNVAFLATNGWWGFDFNPNLLEDQSIFWFEEKEKISQYAALEIKAYSEHDARYMINSVRKLQTQKDVSSIVLITHTVPAPWLISHDIELVDTWRFNSMGNSLIEAALKEDTEHKIKTWCFGHYHLPIEVVRNNITYVSNPRGQGDSTYSQSAYYPKRVRV
jgi:hypothetical protein